MEFALFIYNFAQSCQQGADKQSARSPNKGRKARKIKIKIRQIRYFISRDGWHALNRASTGRSLAAYAGHQSIMAIIFY